MKMQENILTAEQVAKILQIHPFTVLKFIKLGKIKASKIGRVYRIRESDVYEFLDQTTEKSKKASNNTDKPELIKDTKPSVLNNHPFIKKQKQKLKSPYDKKNKSQQESNALETRPSEVNKNIESTSKVELDYSTPIQNQDSQEYYSLNFP